MYVRRVQGVLLILISVTFLMGCEKTSKQNDEFLTDDSGVLYSKNDVSDDFIDFFKDKQVHNFFVEDDYYFVVYSDNVSLLNQRLTCLSHNEILWTTESFRYLTEFKKLDDGQYFVEVSTDVVVYESFVIGIDGNIQYDMGHVTSVPIKSSDESIIVLEESKHVPGTKSTYTLKKIYQDSETIILKSLYSAEIFQLSNDKLLITFLSGSSVTAVIFDYEGNELNRTSFNQETEITTNNDWIIVNDNQNDFLHTYDFHLNKVSSIYFNTYIRFNVSNEIFYNPWEDYTVYIDNEGVLNEDINKIYPNRISRTIGYYHKNAIIFDYNQDFFMLNNQNEILWEHHFEKAIDSIIYKDGITSVSSDGAFFQYDYNGNVMNTHTVNLVVCLITSNNNIVAIDGTRGFGFIYMLDKDFNILWKVPAKSKISEVHETVEGNIVVSYFSNYDFIEDFAFGPNVSQIYSHDGTILKDYTTLGFTEYAFSFNNKTYILSNGTNDLGVSIPKKLFELDSLGNIENEYILIQSNDDYNGYRIYYAIMNNKLFTFKRLVNYVYTR